MGAFLNLAKLTRQKQFFVYCFGCKEKWRYGGRGLKRERGGLLNSMLLKGGAYKRGGLFERGGG